MLIHDSFSSIGVTLAIMRELEFGAPVPLRRALAIDDDLPRRPRTSGGRGRAPTPSASSPQLPWFAKNVALKVLLTVGLGKVLDRLGRPVPEWPY